MTMTTRRKRLILTVTAALGVSLVGATAASAAIDSGDISACRAKSTGAVRIIDKGKKCGSTETAVSWNKAGATGKQGLRGPQGDTGPTASAYLQELEVTIPWESETAVPAVTCDEGDLATSAFYQTAVDGVPGESWNSWTDMQADPGTGFIIGTQERVETWPMEPMDEESDLIYWIRVQCLDLNS